MRPWTLPMLAVAALLAAPALEPAAEEPAARETASFERYEVILERSIFSPRRGPGRSEPEAPEPAEQEPVEEPPPPDPRTQFILMGVSRIGTELYAFFDDRAGNRTLVLQEGEEVQGGLVARIDLDGVQWSDPEEREVQVRVGWSLLGEPASGSDRPAAGRTQRGQQARPSDPPGSESILERLRQRRAEELER